MPAVISVKFPYNVRELWFDPAGTDAQEADHVICRTERGLEVGLATTDAREVTDEELRARIGTAQLREVVRVATDDDLDRADELARKGDDAMPAFRRLVQASGLDMKPVGVQYLFEGDKAVCYFAAEDRVDFRQLVRDLSREFHTRIDMRQIGVREEAAIVGGWGHCGQELCCRRFNTSFDPVSIRMAKEQDLPLNSTKISGACGRLMCCLRYEFEAYRDFKGRAPKRNAVIDTPLGKGKIVEYDTPKESICLRLESGKQVRVRLADMTASEAAVKKSEELGCACRPDTVSRAVLERLESPDVQMALAELDRKNGVVPVEGPDEADLFVEPKRKRRRASGGAGAEGAGGPAEGGERKAHRRSGAGAGAADGAGSGPDAAAGGAGTQGQARRRKRHAADGADAGTGLVGAATGQDAGGQGGASRRRRHHQAGEGAPDGAARSQAGAQDATDAAERGGQGAQAQRAKRTRHPGDKGGAAQAGERRQGGQGDKGAQGGQGRDQAQGKGQQQGQGGQQRRKRQGGQGQAQGDKAKKGQQGQGGGRSQAKGQAPGGSGTSSGAGASADASQAEGAQGQGRRRRRRRGSGGGSGPDDAPEGGSPSAE